MEKAHEFGRRVGVRRLPELFSEPGELLQLIAKGKELAEKAWDPGVAAVVLGEEVHQYAMEYVAHGADVVIAAEHPLLKDYPVETYTAVLAEWVRAFCPEIFIAGATSFGREFFRDSRSGSPRA